MAGLQDLQDRVLGLSRAQTIDRITGLQDYKIYRINCVGLNWGLKMDRIAGLQDLQDRVLGLSWGLKMDRMAGFRRLWQVSRSMSSE
jgi:hypothetical protein